MSAATIIRRIRDGGGEVRLAKDKLNLRLPENLHEALIREIKAEKEAIRRALKEEVGAGWDGDDYLSFFHERAAIRENDGGMSREWAESWAFEDVLAEWLNRPLI